MPRPKKAKEKVKEEIKQEKPVVVNKKNEVVKMLLNEIPGLFDQFPRGSISHSALERLVDKIEVVFHG